MGNATSVLQAPSTTQIWAGVGAGVVILLCTDNWGAGVAGGAGTTLALAWGGGAVDLLLRESRTGVVVITGCDSGLGYSLALHAHRSGHTVLAGCLRSDGPGAKSLQEQCPGNKMKVMELDVRRPEAVTALRTEVEHMTGGGGGEGGGGLPLVAVVNNAGVMVFGEFEWQTEEQRQQQMDVNVLGTLRVTRALMPLLRRDRGRIVVVTSACASHPLPGLSVYGATKFALRGFCDALRAEVAKYDVQVVQLVPGSFMDRSNIMAAHGQRVDEMRAQLTDEQKNFYGDYFDRFHEYLMGLAGDHGVQEMKDERLYFYFDSALNAQFPRAEYTHSPWRYSLYHGLMDHSPVWFRDRVVNCFVAMPSYNKKSGNKP